MSEVRDDFLRLIRDKSKSPEEIYNEMYQKHKELYSTRQILRGLKSWQDCIYQGSIGENDFIMAEASPTALDPTNIAMIHDDYKETIIKFIEHFRQEYDKNPNEHIINLTIIATNKVLKEMFKGTTRNGDVAQSQRKSACKFDEEWQFYKYKVSDQKKEGRAAVCCENNTTLGNIFQFIGFDTFHISGVLCHKDSDKIVGGDAHAFVLIKYGIDDSKYALFDAFNGILIRNVLPENYNLANGFRIEHQGSETLIYEIDGPLYQVTDEILKVEKTIRRLSRKLDMLKYKTKNNLEVEEELNIDYIKEEFVTLIDMIEKSNMEEIFKNRYITRINTYYMDIIEKLSSQTRH